MDNLYRNELEFLDLTNLDANGREELTAILKPNNVTEGLKLPWDSEENDYHVLSEHIEHQEISKDWHQYEMEANLMKYEAQTNNSSVLVTVPSTIQYNQQLIAPVYDWAPSMYINNIANDPNLHSYLQGMTYSQNMYATSNDNQEIPSMVDGGRRNRGRGTKNYNRNINHTSEIQTGYLGDHGQYPLNISCQPVLCVTDSVALQQHPGGQSFYFPPPAMYHSPNMAQQAHRVDCPPYHQPLPNNKYNRPSQSLIPQTNGESTKNTIHKSYDKRVQNVNMAKPSVHQTLDDDNPSQTNIVTTVIVNNANIDSNIKDIDENLTNINNSNKKFDLKIEQHIVSTRNENYKGVEKKDIPCVNIKSSIEVKQNGNDKEYDETTSSCIKTPVKNTTSKPTAKTPDEELQNKEVKEVSITENTLEKNKINEIPVTTLSPANTRSLSWASIVKQDSEPHFASAKKPTAFIAPNNIISINRDQMEQSIEKTQLTPKNYQNKLLSETDDVQQKTDMSKQQRKSLNNEIPRLHCDDPVTYRMGEFLLSYQMDKQTVSLLPRGLTNRSNYCYINSILQALLACPLFYNLLMAMPYSKNPSRHSPSPLIDNMIKFVREFTPLSEAARLARKDRAQKRNEDAPVDIQSGIPFEPSYIYTILKNTSSPGVFSVEGRQEDAEEFLSCLLNGISDEMLELMKLANNNDQKSVECEDANINYNQGEEEWKVMGPKNKGSITRSTDFGRTPLSDIFRGQLRSRVSRATEQATDYVQPFFTLQLDIEKAESVKSALEILVGKDQLEGMTCSKTKQQIEAWKQVTLEELPVILILHLKWFDYKPDGCSKIVKNVEFPIDLKIDVKLISANARSKLSPKQRQYKLFAVTYHDGKEATKGHYVTDAFHVGYGGWVRYDDSSLKGVSESSVLNPLPPSVPYLLYYRRCDTIGNNQSNTNKSR